MNFNRTLFVVAVGFSLACLVVLALFLRHAFHGHASEESSASVLQLLPSQVQENKSPKKDAFVPDRSEIDTRPKNLHEAYRLLAEGQQDAALDEISNLIQSNPGEIEAYLLRGSIYCDKKLWGQATQDYKEAQKLDDKNPIMQFNLVEVDFMQKKYDVARPGFVALQKDAELGDLASYKMFLCDLFGGHQDVASRELDAFNQAGSNPSYYFSNAAWNLYYQKPEDARTWLVSADRIYFAGKNDIYASSLRELGYLPLPPVACSQ